MTCGICSSDNVREIKKEHRARYKNDTVVVSVEAFHCDDCSEDFFTPDKARLYTRAVKNEIRKKDGLLSPERITEIRKKLGLTQEELEHLLGTGPKVVVRWESGKVIQGSGHDNLLRLLEREPTTLNLLRQIQQLRSAERTKYASSQTRQPEGTKERNSLGISI